MTIDPAATIDPTATIHPTATIGSGVAIGARARIDPGVYVAARTSIGDDVVIGPNAAILGDESATPTTIGESASIGANASILAAVTVGPHAVVGAGSVVNRDVPPFATAVGAPARIVGYQSSPGFTAGRGLRASSLADDELPLSIGRATLTRLPLITDLRGSLSFGETPTHLPFAPKRYFLVFDVPSPEVRGEHAHHSLHQLLICVRGECAIATDDGSERGQVVLDRPDTALHLPPLVWGSQYRFSADATLLVLASDVYEADDYIRTYDEFLSAVNDG